MSTRSPSDTHSLSSDAFGVAAEEEYVRIAQAMLACSNLDELREVWIGNQADIVLLPKYWRDELTADKDWHKAKLQKMETTA